MTNTYSILLVEDQEELWRTVEDSLSPLGYKMLFASNKDHALLQLKNHKINLILLDLKLGADSGIDILNFVRRQDQLIPVIILSSLSDLATRQKCFEIGADDYLVKPYMPEELVMRTQRALKRTQEMQPQESSIKESISLGRLTLFLEDRTVEIDGQRQCLRTKLYQMLLLFMQNPNNTIKKEMFHSLLWQNELYDENSLNVHIHQLRKIIGNSKDQSPRIVTVPKLGYRLEHKES